MTTTETPALSDLETRLLELEMELSEANAERTHLQEKLGGAVLAGDRSEITAIQDRIETLDSRWSALKAAIKTLGGQIAKAQGEETQIKLERMRLEYYRLELSKLVKRVPVMVASEALSAATKEYREASGTGMETVWRSRFRKAKAEVEHPSGARLDGGNTVESVQSDIERFQALVRDLEQKLGG